MQIAAEALTAEAAYRLLVGSVVPRPIAWVTSISEKGLVNAAPFSAFTFVSNKPPMIAISIGRKAGVLKDTARNILAQREFVVNIADLDLLDDLHRCATEYEPDISEIVELEIDLRKGAIIQAPLIARAPVALECRLHATMEFGDFRSALYVGEIAMFHVRDDLLNDGKISTVGLRPICRLAGPHYASVGEIITKPVIPVTPK